MTFFNFGVRPAWLPALVLLTALGCGSGAYEEKMSATKASLPTPAPPADAARGAQGGQPAQGAGGAQAQGPQGGQPAVGVQGTGAAAGVAMPM